MCDSQVIQLTPLPPPPPPLLSILSILKDFPVRQYAQAACDTEGTSIIQCVCSFLEHSSDPSMKSTCRRPILAGKDPAGTYDRCDQRRLRRACVPGSRSLTKFKVDEYSSQIKILDIYVRFL